VTAIPTEKISEHIGAEVLGVDIERLLADEQLPDAVMDALEAYSVLLSAALTASTTPPRSRSASGWGRWCASGCSPPSRS
jgi:hypothetical protein